MAASLPGRPRPLVDLCGWPIIFALLLRLGLVVVALLRHPGRLSEGLFWTADTRRYLELAASLLQGRFATAEGPEIFRVPGYPLLLSPSVWMGWPTAGALLTQTLLCGLLVAMVVHMARLIGLSDRAAAAAGFLCALEPTLLLWSLLLMAEAPFAVVVTASLWALFAYLRDGSPRALAAATVLAALAAYVKVAAYGLFAVVSLVVAWAAYPMGARRASRLFAATALAGGLILGAWHVRNWSVADYSAFSTQIAQANGHGDFWAWRAAHPDMTTAEARLEYRRRALNLPMADRPLRIEGPFLPRIRIHLRGSWWAATSPGVITWLQFLDLEARGMAATMDLLRNGRWRFLTLSTQDRPYVVWGAILLGGLNLAYWALFVVGLLRLRRENRSTSGGAILLIAYFLLASGGPWGQSRFRVPFVGALCVVAGAAFDRGKRQDGRGGSVRNLPDSEMNPRTTGGLPHGH